MPAVGLHLVIYLTFVAALAVATVRAVRDEPDALLTGMLAWSAVFGLGTGAYFVGRSTPDDLIALFFPWSLALALLTIPALRALAAASWRRPPLVALTCVFGFAAMACSLAQVPTPWGQLNRLQRTGPRVLAVFADRSFVAHHTARDEHVALLLPLGHRLGAALGVVDVVPYSSVLTMPTIEQLDETLAALHKAGGHKLFLAPGDVTTGMEDALRAAGFTLAARGESSATQLWLDRGA
jgi:hypothetical protein